MSGRDTVSPRSADRMAEHNRSVLFRRRRHSVVRIRFIDYYGFRPIYPP